MGVVVAAHHLELDQPVAIKVLHEGAGNYQESAERFRREARVAAKIQSDHVTRILDVGEMASGARYMVMEYLVGQDLGAELQQRGSFSIGEACGLMLEALDALERAHAAGIVHRDIKPENLFLARRPDGSLRLKVLDFGISKQMGEADELSLTKTSEWIGTPLYMSPEQMESPRMADARSDVWSLGAVLYELISGKPPYEAESLPQLCSLLLTREPVDIRHQRPGIPDQLAEIIMGCLKRDVSLRIQSAAALAEALSQFATRITGSGRRSSMLAQTELGTPTVSTSQVRALGVSAQQINTTNVHLDRTSTYPFTSRTMASTPPEKRSSLRFVLPLAAAVIAACAAAVFLSRSSVNEAQPHLVGLPAQASSDTSPVSEAETPKVEQSEPRAETESPAAPGDKASPQTDLAIRTEAQEPTAPETATKTTAPEVKEAPPANPQAKRPAKASGQRASDEGPPSKALGSEEIEEFADFGGRR